MQEQYVKLVLLYEKKDKKKLREGMDSNRMNFPFMLFGNDNRYDDGKYAMNHMNTGDFMQEAYDQGYADGSGEGGFMEGGDFADGGGEGGFMVEWMLDSNER